MINPNKFIGLKQQQSMGQLTDPQSFQQQFNVNRFTQPLAVPGDQNQTMSPMMQQEKSKVQTVQNDPKLQKGSDASYGISGYVNTEKEYKQALQEKNHPNVYDSPAKQTKRRATQPLPKPDMPDNRLKRTTEKIEQVTQQNAPLKQTDFPHAKPGTKYNYKKEELLDADDFSEISGQSDLAAEKYSDIQQDEKGQYVTSLGQDEYFKKSYDKNFKRPTSSKHIDKWSEKEVLRDTIRPRSGKAFISTWKLNK
jgi:hypothetical protein